MIEDEIAKNPRIILEKWKSTPKEWIVIDEVQKIPKLLDIVHIGIEEHNIKFALTGSSARKIKHGSSNMLAGRAFMFNMFPLTSFELGTAFNIDEVLNFGTLPKLYSFTDDIDKKRFLKSYALTYLKEEVQQEQLVKKLDPFRKFLELSAQVNGEVINYSNIAKACNVDHKTVQSYYQILNDTLLGFFLDTYSGSIRTKQIVSPKFYYFDNGVVRALQGQLESLLTPATYGYGKVFEHFVILECLKISNYLEKDYKFSYLRSNTGLEIDLIIEKPNKETFFIEIKSSKSIQEKDYKNLVLIKGEVSNSFLYIFCQEEGSRITEHGIKIINWQEGIKELFGF
jgi:predicted AAA+ superfamily ATPase